MVEVGDRVLDVISDIEGTVVEITDEHIKYEADDGTTYWWDRTFQGLLYKKRVR